MHLSVYSLKEVLFEGETKSLNCMSGGGEITILDNHEPLIATIKPCTLKVTDKDGKDHFIPVGSGFLEVKSDSTRILID